MEDFYGVYNIVKERWVRLTPNCILVRHRRFWEGGISPRRGSFSTPADRWSSLGSDRGYIHPCTFEDGNNYWKGRDPEGRDNETDSFKREL